MSTLECDIEWCETRAALARDTLWAAERAGDKGGANVSTLRDAVHRYDRLVDHLHRLRRLESSPSYQRSSDLAHENRTTLPIELLSAH